MLCLLDQDSFTFPDPQHALDEPNGLLAVGGDLQPERILEAYRLGIFPWYEEGQPILWWSPDPRMVLFPDELHVSRSLRKALKKHALNITVDSSFDAVITACAEKRPYAAGTWITRAVKQAYSQLFTAGYAHSVEVWDGDELVGGLYGLVLGKVFYGESMFSRRDNVSKIAFYYLVRHLQLWEYEIIDCQVASHFLAGFGAREISREAFQRFLPAQQQLDVPSGWAANWDCRRFQSAPGH
ncbi:MAG: leucyl/phenylalanyl-tRNA--protein transferase [Pseudohongiellaceae bacterium]